MPKLSALSVLVVCGLLAGCVYKIDIDQGNLLPADAIEQLQVGMTMQQVRYLLGTPAIVDPFHPDRWDYVYSEQKGNGPYTEKRLTLYFKNDRLAEIDRETPSDGARS